MFERLMRRETFIKSAAAGAGALTFGAPAFIPARSEAADRIVLGMTNPLTGTYASLGQGQMRGAQMAVAAWNKRGGVMGREVDLLSEDDAADPGVAVEKARKLVNQGKAVALVGTVSSATTLSVSSAANALGKVFIDMGGSADSMSGKDCKWGSFRTCKTAYQLTHATGFVFQKNFGKRWYMITPDYAFGHGLAAGYTAVAEQAGATIVGNDFTPLGTTEFSSYLLKVQAAKPDVLIVNVSGNDFVSCMKQAQAYNILKNTPVGGPLMELEGLWALPESARMGYWGVEWYFSGDAVLGKKQSAIDFVRQYRKAHGTPPTARSCFGYITVDRLLTAMSETKSTDAVKVARALEGSEFDSPLWSGKAYIRKDDHQMMWPMWVAKVRPSGVPGDKYDTFEDFARVDAERITVPVSEVRKTCTMSYPS
ncbi:ABC transporter substrate-binding protein [bacterium]|nr:MAG: ABC transporter substrate-binding protein [bacterium]